MFCSLLTKSHVLKISPLLKVTGNIKVDRNYANELNHVQVEAVELAYASYESTRPPDGDGPPPLIINHGLFGSKANWNSISKALHQKTVPQRKIIAVDLRNHGDSPHNKVHGYRELAEDVKALLKNLGIQRASLLGHSMGGRAVMMFALKYPDLVDKLIVADISPVNSSPNISDSIDMFDLLKKVQMPKQGPMSVARADVDQQLAKQIPNKMLRSFLLTNLVEKSDGSFNWRINLPALSSNFRENIMSFPKLNYTAFKGPTLFVGGEKSDFIPKKDHTSIQKLFPKAEFKYIADAGHWLHADKPQDFLDICLEFLNK